MEKKKFSITDNAVIHLLITFLMVLVGQIVGGIIVGIPIGIYAGAKMAAAGITTVDPTEATMLMNSLLPDSVITGQMYATFIGIWLVALLWFLIPGNKPLFKAIGTKMKGNNLKYLGIGTAMGFALNALCVLGAYLNQDIKLYFDSFRPISFVIIFLMVFVQSSAEELVCRGFLYQKLLHCYKKPVVAILGNSILFAALHLGNDGVTVLALINIALFGILASLMVYYFDSIWCAMAVHAAWNFTQNILFGLPNSGNVVPYSVMKLDAGSAVNSWAYNVGFGVEGTILADVVLALACLGLWYWGKKSGRKPTNIWEDNAEQVAA